MCVSVLLFVVQYRLQLPLNVLMYLTFRRRRARQTKSEARDTAVSFSTGKQQGKCGYNITLPGGCIVNTH